MCYILFLQFDLKLMYTHDSENIWNGLKTYRCVTIFKVHKIT